MQKKSSLNPSLLCQLMLGSMMILGLLYVAKLLAPFIGLPISIVGLLLCCSLCLILGRVPNCLEVTGGILLKYMPIFFIPLIVDISRHWAILKPFWLICLLALFVSTLLSMVITAYLMGNHKDKDRRP